MHGDLATGFTLRRKGIAESEIDFIHLKGADQGKSELGIFAFEGNHLKLCTADLGNARPTEFIGKEKSSWSLLVLERKE